MKTAAIICLALVVVVVASDNNKVNVVDPGYYVGGGGGNNGVPVVNYPDPGYTPILPNNGQQVNVVDNTQTVDPVKVVDHADNSNNGGAPVIVNPDPYFYQGGGNNGVHVVDNSGYRPVPESYNRDGK